MIYAVKRFDAHSSHVRMTAEGEGTVEERKVSSKGKRHEAKGNRGPSAERLYCAAKNALRPRSDYSQTQTKKNEIQTAAIDQQMEQEILGEAHLKAQQNQALTIQVQWFERVTLACHPRQ